MPTPFRRALQLALTPLLLLGACTGARGAGSGAAPTAAAPAGIAVGTGSAVDPWPSAPPAPSRPPSASTATAATRSSCSRTRAACSCWPPIRRVARCAPCRRRDSPAPPGRSRVSGTHFDSSTTARSRMLPRRSSSAAAGSAACTSRRRTAAASASRRNGRWSSCARSAAPPRRRSRAGPRRAPELVALTALDSTIHLDVRYATTNNFMGARFYDEPRAFLQRPAAEAVARVRRAPAAARARAAHARRVSAMVRDLDVLGGDAAGQKRVRRRPGRGSRHNRGAAVDLSLYDLATGAPMEMPSGYDEFSPRACADWPGRHLAAARGTATCCAARWRRRASPSTLRVVALRSPQLARYPISNVPFAELDRSH